MYIFRRMTCGGGGFVFYNTDEYIFNYAKEAVGDKIFDII